MASSFIGSSSSILTRLQTYPSQRLQTLRFNPFSRTPYLKNKELPSLGYMRIGRREFALFGSINQSGVPSGSPPNSWRGWLLGMVVTIILPFFTHKWGPLLQVKNRVDTMVQTAEDIIDAIEVVAEKVDKVAEHIADDLPEGGKFRKAVDFIEDVAENIAKDAHLASDLIDKVQDAEDKLETMVEPLINQQHKEKDISQEASDQQ